MVMSDVEMDADEIKESVDKLHSGDGEGKEEESPPSVSAAVDSIENGCGQEKTNEVRNNATNINSVDRVMECLDNQNDEASEPINTKEYEEKLTDTEKEGGNEELSNSTNSADQTVAKSSVEGKIVAISGIVTDKPKLNDKNFIENGTDSRNHVIDAIEEKPSAFFSNKQLTGSDQEDTNPSKVSRNEVGQVQEDEEMKDVENVNEEEEDKNVANLPDYDQVKDVSQNKEIAAAAPNDDKTSIDDERKQHKVVAVAALETDAIHTPDVFSLSNQKEPVTPTSVGKLLPAMAGDQSGEKGRSTVTPVTPITPLLLGGSDDGTPEEQVAFMREVESFYHERAIDFKAPKFYGQQLNCLKLWRSVIRLGGYDRVTGAKLWRQVGESFHPPKTCTTVSWTFRIFYEKSLLEYERHMIQTGELQLPVATPEACVDIEANGSQGSLSGRARRDAAARAMQGWHTQLGLSEVVEPNVKDKNLTSMGKREKNIKSIGSVKQRKPNEVEHPAKVPQIETPKQLRILRL